ncbi:MAG: FtsK/SpoIIIE domain-containing protein [Dehalococcoidales bacterium]
MQLQSRARRYSRVVGLLYQKKDIKARLKSATRGARHLSLGIRLADPLTLGAALKMSDSLALAVNVSTVISGRVDGLVNYQFQLPGGYWQHYTRADLSSGLGVGLGESRREVVFSFDPPHTLVAGSTGSGKSETLRTILAGLMTAHEPPELGVILVDPHNDFESFASCSHLVMPTAGDDESIDRAITYAGQELARRREHSIKDGRRLVVAIDEAQTTLPRDKAYLEIVTRIGEGGRKYRIHLLLASQRATAKNLPMINSLRNRFVGAVSDARESSFVSGHADLQCHKLTGSGDTVHVAGPVRQRFQVALCSDDDLATLPRGQIVEPPDVAGEDTNPTLNFPTSKPPGRPETEIEPVKVAHYLAHGPQNITIAWARDNLDLARYAHSKHRDFATELAEELAKLQRAMEESDE